MATGDVEVIGGSKSFWLYSKEHGFDLTHPATPTSPLVYPRIPLQTRTAPISIDPKKTALVVIDLQNYFLSPALGRPTDAVGLKVVDKLLQVAIPACRKAGIPIVWLNWGVTEEDIETMPPTILKGFRLGMNFVGDWRPEGVGFDVGPVKLADGLIVEGGKMLMPEQWNSALYAPLEEVREPQDIWINKNRESGFWGGRGVEEALSSRGIRTLLFAGANTDQCVGGSLQDAFTKGWDCIMLDDGCATTSPDFSRQCIEYNAAQAWGFVLSCADFARGVGKMQGTPHDRP
ncbi:MAG: hypothetical protein Q9227_006008 [Pyrenula ochraceoflavens]